ncbi:FAD/NAD(P)-binding protein [Streptacidiphilus albus]|uniref:FAD/NAD(P)-binding protein n=1 Tax=Streptacidiphilus albus TaxID=105425 RepID=UPI00054BA66A|nr:FAD/NAD(P)-binding protein [Streptacidiphilus albus]
MPSRLAVCIVGAGPRGLSVLERLCANARVHPCPAEVTVHVVDPHRPGAGRVWRTDQSRQLLMNTVASQVTVFTDDSVDIEGPIEPGPSLYEWARALAAAGARGPAPAVEACELREAGALAPDSYPTRALYGRYLQDAFERVVARAPAHVRVHVHRCRAVALDDSLGPGGAQQVMLEDGTALRDLDAVVIAQGHVPVRPSAQERRLSRFAQEQRLLYVRPGNPADLDLSRIAPGERVLLRGLGLNFFDHMALLTVGRGGVLERGPRGRLRYRASGREPRLHAGSRRGVPYQARGDNEKGAHGRHVPRLLTEQLALRLRGASAGGGGLDFRRQLWPLIAAEVEGVYYGAWLAERGRGGEREGFERAYLAAGGRAGQVLARYAIPREEHWDWERVARPGAGRRFADRAAFRAWLLDYLRQDVDRARQGNVSGPVKAALDVLRDLRNEIRLAVDHGGLHGDSHREDLDGWYTPLNAFLSIGPPASRIEEMVALIEAGVLEVMGPDMRVEPDPAGGGFRAVCAVPGPPVRARVLIEARLPEPDLRRTADPLLHRLLGTGQCRTHRIAGAGGGRYETGGLAVSERPYRVLDARGVAHPRRFAYGVPTEAVHWVTAAGIRPGVNSVTLGDSDAIARAVLALAPAAVRDPAPAAGRLAGVGA